jgi:hypothetical protein
MSSQLAALRLLDSLQTTSALISSERVMHLRVCVQREQACQNDCRVTYTVMPSSLFGLQHCRLQSLLPFVRTTAQ